MSEWPTSLMLDEIWLSARRAMVVSFEQKGLWLSPPDYKEQWRLQLEKGNQLRAALLPAILGKKDYNLLSSEVLFGKYNQHFKRKLPFSLAFGDAIGGGLYNAHNSSCRYKKEVTDLCALFNLGISLFDFILDQVNNKAIFGKLVTRESLEGLQTQQSASFLNKIKSSECRILLKIIAGFYKLLFALLSSTEQSPNQVMALLNKAYKAEMLSTEKAALNNRKMKVVIRNKSVLPFLIMGSIACIPARLGGTGNEKDLHLSRRLGEVFWRADDMADIITDYQSDQPNLFLLQVTRSASVNADPCLPLHQLLEKPVIKRESTKILYAVDSIISDLYKRGENPSENFQFRQALLFYLKDWFN